MLYALVALLAINVITFATFALDKWKAERRRRRIPESWLLALAAFGGALGAWMAMNVLRHKSQKRSFQWRLILATLANGVWIWLAYVATRSTPPA